MAEFNLNEEYLSLIKTVSAKNGISDDEVVETALAYFLKMYFRRFDMFAELERVNKVFQQETVDPEEIKKRFEEDKSAVDAAIAEAQRLGLL
jgi:hypothetical protein